MNVQSVELKGITIHYQEYGGKHLPPMVMLHALGKDGLSWKSVAEELSEKYHIYTLDMRGHGKSEYTNEYSFELMYEDVKLFVDKLGIDKFTLVGHSMGGTVAYIFAENDSSRLEKLIIEDTPPPIEREAVSIPESPNAPVPFDWNVVQELMKQLNEPNPKWWSDLSNISVPTLIIGGGESSNIPQDQLKEVHDKIVDCQFVTIDAGHHIHETSLEKYVEVLQEFLS
ncbi:alpha/beta fold hydrolase [Oceanobacillus kimchii]|uniref:alpha/beta fold hydrolase n=1 Tax=Oceanobacillus kimchii TaxID=746691 RepID=UPI000986BDF3|nr:alpha/beta hydrolase [Oceanobacillus kimchii]